jgi:hypothetical protein
MVYIAEARLSEYQTYLNVLLRKLMAYNHIDSWQMKIINQFYYVLSGNRLQFYDPDDHNMNLHYHENLLSYTHVH